jgi:uncharacterized cupin superfamily protein
VRSGQAVLRVRPRGQAATTEDGATVELRPGVSLVAPAGWRGRWDVRETVRKTYVIWQLP